MASYLGKISAIVSANTAGYVRSLNDAAAQTRDFAKTIRSDITRSSNDASKAFNSILSPLQKLQRALDAASSQRLSFKGVEGAINNVKQLRQQINEIRDLQLAVRITGADGIDDLRENLLSLSSTDIQAAVRVTGSEDVEQLQRRLNRFSDRTVNLLARAAGVENIDQLAEKVDSLSDRELRLSVRAINENAIERAKRQLEQLTSASAEIATPLAAANRQLTGFAAEIQAALLPGFSQVQKAALQLEQDIQSGARIGEERYTRLRQVVEQTAAAVQAVGQVDLGSPESIRRFESQLSAVNEAALEIASRQLRIDVRSEELEQVRQEIDQVNDGLESLPPLSVRLQGDREFAEIAEQVEAVKQRLSDVQNNRINIDLDSEQAAAEVERLARELQVLRGRQVEIKAKFDAETQSELGRLESLNTRRIEIEADVQVNDEDLQRSLRLLEEARNAAADFEVAQGQQALGRRIGDGFLTILPPAEAAADTLQAKQQELGRRIGDGFLTILTPAEAAADTLQARQQELGRRIGDGFLTILTPAEAAADTLQARQQELGRRIANGFLNVLTPEEVREDVTQTSRARREEEAESIRRVSEALSRLREQSDFIITGDVQNFDQVRSELSSILGQISQLDESSRSRFDLNVGAINRILSEGSLNDLSTARQLLRDLNDSIAETRRVDIETAEAQREADQLAATIDRLRANADFAITGRPQNLDQVQSELQRILGTVDRLNDEQRAGLRVSAVVDAINAQDFEAAERAFADLKRQIESGAEFNINAEQAKKAAEDVRNRLMAIDDRIEFTITGRVQNFDQARQELSAVLGDVSRLEQAQRETFSQRLQSAGEIIESAEIGKLDQAANILQEIRSELAGIKGSPVRDLLGASLDDPIRQVDVLKGGINSLQGQLDNLPAPIRQRFLPELRRLRDQFTQAEKSPQRFGQELENAADDVRRLSAEVRRISQAQGLGSFADNLDDTALRGAIGNLQALQQILNRVGATAGSEGARQFDRLRAAIQRATREGTVGSEAFQRELKQITQDAAAAAAATGKIGRSAAFREIQRGGDIARGGFDKFSLAAQQAAFAIDDFFSATGDFTQKIRAVQNNVTQLAFIVGSTEGLFLALGASIAAQAAVALVKWAEGSVGAEDKTQALNDALARQKSLVEELKQAFDSLGDSLTRGIFDEVTERAREFNRQIEDIRRKSAEVRQEQAASLDAGVNEQRAIQVDLRSQLDRETDAGARVGIARRIAASQEEERRLARQAANRRVDVEGVLREVAESFSEQADAAVKDIFADSTARAGPTAAERFAAAREADALSQPVIQRSQSESEAARRAIRGAGGNALDIAEILDGRVQELSDRLSESVGPQETRAINQQIGELESVLRSLKAPIERALLELRLNILDSAQEVAGSLRASKDIIENSLGDFGPLAAVQRELSSRFNAVVKELRTGRLGGEDDGRELNREEIQQRKAVLERLQQETQQLESTTRSAEALEQAFRRLADQLAETVRQEAAADVERTRRAANAAEARDGNGLDDFRRAAEREFAQGPQVEPLIDLEPLRARVQADQEAATAAADRAAADLRAIVDADEQRRDEEFRIVEETANRISGGDLRRFARDELAENLGSDDKVDASLAARGQLQSRAVEEVRQAFVDAGADASTIDDIIADRLKFQEDEQKYWARVGDSYTEETRKLKAAEAALDSAFSTDEEQQKFVAAYNELTARVELGVDGASKRLSEITKQFTDRLSDEQLAELTTIQDSSTRGRPGPVKFASKQDIGSRGGRLKAAMDEFGFETVEGFRSAFSSQDLNLEGINEAIRKQITDSLAPGQLTPSNIQAIADNYSIERSRANTAARGALDEINDFREGGGLDGTGIFALDQLGSRLSDSERELSSAEFSNERNQELAAEIESIRNAIDAFDGSLESRRAIAEAADASRFDEIADAADIFLQKVRDLDLERAVSAFEEQIALEGQQRIEQLDQQRQEFQRNAQERFQREALRGNAPEGIADAIRQRDELLSVNNRTAEQESQLTQASEAIRNAFEQTAEGQQAARLADEIDIERQRQVQAREQRDAVRESAARGQDLLLRPEDVAARRGLTQFEDAQNAVLENLIGPLKEVGGDGVAAEIEDGILSLQELAQIFKRSPEIRQQLEGEIQDSLANLQQARDNITGNISAQIAQFDVERSRPSRQALQAQDINTQQGRAELNRLLRGDDANRDQPILQGIKEQTAILKLIDQRIDEVKTAVGVAGA